ncbi:MAG: hypothetical protein M3297_09990 [Thermoproteota archaeon]|nr:hypothetical protein [Thermoproteota archaeon]
MSSLIVAKTYGCNIGESDGSNRRIKVAYLILESYESLCIDKKDIIVAQLDACDRLLKYTADGNEKEAIMKEIKELKTALNILGYN